MSGRESDHTALNQGSGARDSAAASDDRCGNTIHSDYVSDHRCQRERGHTGDCLFGVPDDADFGLIYNNGHITALRDREDAERMAGFTKRGQPIWRTKWLSLKL